MRNIVWIHPVVRRRWLLLALLLLPALLLAAGPYGSAAQAGPAVTIRSNPPTPVGQSVSFGIVSSSGSGTLSYSWDFGDGSPPTAFSTSSTASHAYASPGHFRVWVTVRDGSGATAFSSYVHTSHYALSAARPSASSTIILDGARNRVWVVNPDNDSVTAINGASHARLFEAAVGTLPRTLAQAPDGTIWVVNQAAATISVLNPDTGALLQTISLPAGARPYGIAFSPNGSAAYVTTEGTRQLIKLSPSSRATVGALTLAGPLRGVAVSADSSRVLVTRFISPADRGEVVEVSAATFAVARTIPLAFDTNTDMEANGRGVPNYLSSITISPDGRQARVPSKKDNTARGLFRDGQPLTFESTVRTIVSYIDLTSNAENFFLRLDLNDRDMADAVAYSPLGDYIFVATQGTNSVELFDAYSGFLVTSMLNVGRAPQGLLLSADGTKLYVQNFMSRSVVVYDVAGLVGSTSSSATQLATVSTVTSDKLSAEVLRGKQIFYNADDRRMNRDGYIACASCHLDGDSDGRVWDFTDRGEGLRNTIDLRGKRGVGQGPVHWTANFDEIQDFEHDIRGPFGGTGLMADADFNSGGRNTPLGAPKAGYSADLDALAAFVSSLSEVNRSPFRNADGSLTTSGQAGRTLFKIYCASCHAGADFSDSRAGFLHDVGTIKASSGQRLGQPLTGFDTPGLTGVWETLPYLHDGSAATLRDVLTSANAAGRHANLSALSSAQIDQLTQYLLQIDGLEAASPPSRLFVARLTGAQEVPPVSTVASGVAKVVLLDDGVSARISLRFSGLSSGQTAAHIHGPGGPGVNAPAIITLPTGQVSDYAVTLTAQQASDLRNGLLSINVHSSSFPNGEIRGQLTDAAAPPPTPTPTPTRTPTRTNTAVVSPTSTRTPTRSNTPAGASPTPTRPPTRSNTPAGASPTPTRTATAATTIFFDDFESSKGWTANPGGGDTATLGQWERGDPEQTDSGGVKQLGTTVSGLNDLVTGRLAGASVGSYDIDGGVSSIRSPSIVLPAGATITLSLRYYLAHASNASSADYLRVRVVGATTSSVLDVRGAATNRDATWSLATVNLSSYAGQSIYLLLDAADADTASLVEAAVDDVSITASSTPIGSATPTRTSTSAGPSPTRTPTRTPTSSSALNLALNRPASGSAPCNTTSETAPKAVDGLTNTKFCSLVSGAKWLQVDLGSSLIIGRFVIRHAGSGGESTSYNTRDFNIQISNDGASWSSVVVVSANTASQTTHSISGQAARYVRLNVIAGEQAGSTARIYELEVYGS